MKRFLVFVFGVLLVASPAFVSAQTMWQTLAQRTAVAAALEAQETSSTTGQPLACAALFSAPSVNVEQDIALAWGSVGAIDPLTSSSSVSMWSRNGAATLNFSHAGTWTYSFTFYSATAASTTCSAKVLVTK